MARTKLKVQQHAAAKRQGAETGAGGQPSTVQPQPTPPASEPPAAPRRGRPRKDAKAEPDNPKAPESAASGQRGARAGAKAQRSSRAAEERAPGLELLGLVSEAFDATVAEAPGPNGTRQQQGTHSAAAAAAAEFRPARRAAGKRGRPGEDAGSVKASAGAGGAKAGAGREAATKVAAASPATVSGLDALLGTGSGAAASTAAGGSGVVRLGGLTKGNLGFRGSAAAAAPSPTPAAKPSAAAAATAITTTTATAAMSKDAVEPPEPVKARSGSRGRGGGGGGGGERKKVAAPLTKAKVEAADVAPAGVVEHERLPAAKRQRKGAEAKPALETAKRASAVKRGNEKVEDDTGAGVQAVVAALPAGKADKAGKRRRGDTATAAADAVTRASVSVAGAKQDLPTWKGVPAAEAEAGPAVATEPGADTDARPEPGAGAQPEAGRGAAPAPATAVDAAAALPAPAAGPGPSETVAAAAATAGAGAGGGGAGGDGVGAADAEDGVVEEVEQEDPEDEGAQPGAAKRRKVTFAPNAQATDGAGGLIRFRAMPGRGGRGGGAAVPGQGSPGSGRGQGATGGAGGGSEAAAAAGARGAADAGAGEAGARSPQGARTAAAGRGGGAAAAEEEQEEVEADDGRDPARPLAWGLNARKLHWTEERLTYLYDCARANVESGAKPDWEAMLTKMGWHAFTDRTFALTKLRNRYNEYRREVEAGGTAREPRVAPRVRPAVARKAYPYPLQFKVREVLSLLPGQKGTLKQVWVAIAADPLFSPALDHHPQRQPGAMLWQKQVSRVLNSGSTYGFVDTGERRQGLIVYAYDPDRDFTKGRGVQHYIKHQKHPAITAAGAGTATSATAAGAAAAAALVAVPAAAPAAAGAAAGSGAGAMVAPQQSEQQQELPLGLQNPQAGAEPVNLEEVRERWNIVMRDCRGYRRRRGKPAALEAAGGGEGGQVEEEQGGMGEGTGAATESQEDEEEQEQQHAAETETEDVEREPRARTKRKGSGVRARQRAGSKAGGTGGKAGGQQRAAPNSRKREHLGAPRRREACGRAGEAALAAAAAAAALAALESGSAELSEQELVAAAMSMAGAVY